MENELHNKSAKEERSVTVNFLPSDTQNFRTDEITIDDQDLSKVSLNSYRSQLGVVLQDDFLLLLILQIFLNSLFASILRELRKSKIIAKSLLAIFPTNERK